MKVTVEWLKEYVETDASAEEIGNVLTMLGLELETIEDSPLGPVLDFKVTPNRGDCLSVIGLARELCAKDVHRFKPTKLFAEAVRGWPRGDEDKSPEQELVKIEAPDLCTRYACRLFENIAIANSSERIGQRLSACGMRPINVVVDTTNYVMLELGQPLHAFDRDLLEEGRIVVRTAREGENMTTLDGAKRKLRDDMLMICDASTPVAIAGVMGGENSEVSQNTKRLLLESAQFDPASIRRTRRALGMSTEASYRFERYVDPAGVVRALNRFADLLREQTGIDSMAGVYDAYPKPPKLKTIEVREFKWKKLLGMEVPVAAAASSLQAIGCEVREIEGGLKCVPPTWRSDLALEEDLVEEIGRLWGYEKIPEELPFGSTPQGGESKSAAFKTAARNAMLRLGFTEVANHTLTAPSSLDSRGEPVVLRNPAAPELAQLRTSLLPGIARNAAKNRSRALRLFEIGRVFFDDTEMRMAALLMSGKLYPEDWRGKNDESAGFFALKGVVEELYRLLHRAPAFGDADDRRFMSAKAAKIVRGDGRRVGVLGQIAPAIAEEFDLPRETFLCEVCLDRLFESEELVPSYKPISNFPPVRRDIAFIIEKSVAYAEIEAAIHKSAGSDLEAIKLFDVFEGKGIPAGKHSLAVALHLRAQNKTLTDEEANQARERAVEALRSLGAEPRV